MDLLERMLHCSLVNCSHALTFGQTGRIECVTHIRACHVINYARTLFSVGLLLEEAARGALAFACPPRSAGSDRQRLRWRMQVIKRGAAQAEKEKDRQNLAWYVLEDKEGNRYVGMTANFLDRLQGHMQNTGKFLGARPHICVRSGKLRGTLADAVLEEQVQATVEWAAPGMRKRVRGGAFPGKELEDREWREVERWVQVYLEEGEDALRAQLRAVQQDKKRPGLEHRGVWSHLHVQCWDRECNGFGHFRNSPECPAVIARAEREERERQARREREEKAAWKAHLEVVREEEKQQEFEQLLEEAETARERQRRRAEWQREMAALRAKALRQEQAAERERQRQEEHREAEEEARKEQDRVWARWKTEMTEMAREYIRRVGEKFAAQQAPPPPPKRKYATHFRPADKHAEYNESARGRKRAKTYRDEGGGREKARLRKQEQRKREAEEADKPRLRKRQQRERQAKEAVKAKPAKAIKKEIKKAAAAGK